MTQEQNNRSQTSKRTARAAGRNRPVLVTSTTQTNDLTDDQSVQVSNDSAQPAEESSTAPTSEIPRTRKLPGFFSRVGKSAQIETSGADSTQARLARATRGKAFGSIGRAGTSPASEAPDQKAEASQPVKASPPVPARSAPARPVGGFKMRYILGLAIYLLGAQLIGAYETNILHAYHLDNPLFKLGPVAVSTSTLAFLATLIILLIVLARFDLIPRSLGAMMGQPTPSRKAGSTQSQKTQESVKTPPTMKQGVKGADDDLYQEYQEQRRYQQRRERKR